ncbi:MAG: ankyrin repeat domain-containing protein [Gammaproteobacteria bacterium]
MKFDLIDAVRANDVEQVKILLQEGADPNFCEDMSGITPLHFAAINNCLEIVLLLVAAGAKLNARTSEGERPLDIAKNQPIETHGQMVALLTFFDLNRPDISNLVS